MKNQVQLHLLRLMIVCECTHEVCGYSSPSATCLYQLFSLNPWTSKFKELEH